MTDVVGKRSLKAPQKKVKHEGEDSPHLYVFKPPSAALAEEKLAGYCPDGNLDYVEIAHNCRDDLPVGEPLHNPMTLRVH